MIYLLFLLPALCLCEVTTFSKCPQFFFEGFTPTILKDPINGSRYEQICQCRLDANNIPQYFYATLYDTAKKIPVYSAYVFRKSEVKREDNWNVEPQLEGGNIMCMTTQGHIPPESQGTRQALNSDYYNSGYEKGHLFPVSHTHNRETMLATFTLTNAAPQTVNFNRGPWKKHELSLIPKLQNCKKAFVVVGVIPGQQSIGNGVKEGRYFWNAYCCIDADDFTSAAGYLGPDNNGVVKSYTIDALEAALEHYYGMDFSVFQGICK